MSKNASRALILGAIIIVIALVAAAILRGREAAERATLTIDDNILSVRVADNPWERARGLSGFEAEDVKAHGMLFIFKEPEVQEFWMKGMVLDLDVLWIRENKIVAIERNVPAPKPGEEPARMTSAPIPVDMVLELPAGSVQALGLLVGMPLKVELP